MRKFLLVILVAGLFACQSKKENPVSPETEAFTTERNAFFDYLGKPENTRLQLRPATLSFDSSFLNDPSRLYQYAGNEVKAAANLGIYLADLNYCVLFSKDHFTEKYFAASVELSKVVGMEKTAVDFLQSRYTNNMSQDDSVQAIANSLFARSLHDRKGTSKEKLAGIAMATYQIENLHLALSTLSSFPEKPTEDQQETAAFLLNIVLQQHSNVLVIYNFVKTFSDPQDPDKNPNYPFFDNALRELIGIYQKLNYGVPVKKEDAIKIRSEETIKELHEKVMAVRAKIVDL